MNNNIFLVRKVDSSFLREGFRFIIEKHFKSDYSKMIKFFRTLSLLYAMDEEFVLMSLQQILNLSSNPIDILKSFLMKLRESEKHGFTRVSEKQRSSRMLFQKAQAKSKSPMPSMILTERGGRDKDEIQGLISDFFKDRNKKE